MSLSSFGVAMPRLLMDILFVESATFSKKVDSFLNGDEQDALRLLLE
ncbi:MAG: hypothetical protein L0H75_07050 [Nitrosospira sp.]|nr:hypothetical protein [Nitrosospira sp.]MDN5935922.1 hypothetical protein [Nitrosospira sp.]